jgi:DNA-binding XRE family transcriptional regulator
MSGFEWSPDWLPRKEAAQASGYHVVSLDRIMGAGLVPMKTGPRPAWRHDGMRQIRYIHMPSLMAYKNASRHWLRGGPRPDQMQPSITKLGSALQGWRLEKGWSQKEVAQALHTTNATVSGWERGKRSPSLRMVVMLCELYGLTAEERWAVIEAIAWRESER